jgi:hypothetical protein
VNDLVPRRFQPLVLAALVAAVVVLALNNFVVDPPQNPSPAGFIVTLILTIAVTILLWRFLMQPALAGRRPPARDGLILGVVAVLLAFVVTTGIVFAVAPAAIALGALGREGRAPEGRATAGPDPAADHIPADPKTGTAAWALGWLALLGATIYGVVSALA